MRPGGGRGFNIQMSKRITRQVSDDMRRAAETCFTHTFSDLTTGLDIEKTKPLEEVQIGSGEILRAKSRVGSLAMASTTN